MPNDSKKQPASMKTTIGWAYNPQPPQPHPVHPPAPAAPQAYPPTQPYFEPGFEPTVQDSYQNYQQAYPQQAYPQPEQYPQQAYPQQAYPQPEQYPQPAYPQPELYPQQAYPQQAYPQQEAYSPHQAYPQQPAPPYPQQAYPPHYVPDHHHDQHAASYPAPSLLAAHPPMPQQAKSGKQPKQPKPPKQPRQAKPPKQAVQGAPGRGIAGADATVGVSARLRFIRLTYLHLLGAMLAFGGLLYLFMTNGFLVEQVSIPLVQFALGGRWNWAIVLGAFMVVSWVADYWASHTTSRGVQYLGLAFYILAETLIFIPLLAIVQWKTAAILAKGGGDPNIIRDAAYVTLGIFTALTLSVLVSRKDFSFLRAGLFMATGAALTAVFLALAFGFNLGLIFSVAMVVLAAGYILYQTSQVLAHYHTNQYVGASLALFSSVALMFWYVIRIFMKARE